MNWRHEQALPLHRLLELARPALPRSTEGAESALGEALRWISGSAWPEVAWYFSRINGDGFPVEFTFSSAQPGLRYTAEIRGPEVAESERWRMALEWAGGSALDSSLADRVRQWQAGPLHWGAWIGGFHSETGCRRKAYFEVSSAAESAESRSFMQFPMQSAVSGAKLRFVGLEPGGRETEFYFRKDKLEMAELGRLVCRLGWRECYEPLCEVISDTLPWPTRHWLVPTDAGFSIAPGRALSIFTYARSIWGGDAATRRRILELAWKHGWDFELYETATRPLEAATGYRTGHGILGWISAPGHPIEFRVSVRPPG